MIPKRAIFYWEGPEMSWLRRQALETFRLLNPTWAIDVIGGENVPLQGDSRLAIVGRSDWGRYKALRSGGGVYFDSDIVFCRPIPEQWLEHQMILPFNAESTFGHVAILGMEAGNAWAAMMDDACQRIVSSGNPLNYQSLGLPLANRCVHTIRPYKIQWLEPESFVPVNWGKAELLWQDGVMLSPLSFGIHWYGGDWTSMSLESSVDEAWMSTSKSMIAKAWRKAMKSAGEIVAFQSRQGIA